MLEAEQAAKETEARIELKQQKERQKQQQIKNAAEERHQLHQERIAKQEAKRIAIALRETEMLEQQRHKADAKDKLAAARLLE